MKKILVVDDSPTILSLMRQVLELEHYAVEACLSPVLALSKLTGDYCPDAVITDLNMPDMDGNAFITAARRLPSCRFIPIMVLTTESGQPQRELAKAAGRRDGWSNRSTPKSCSPCCREFWADKPSSCALSRLWASAESGG